MSLTVPDVAVPADHKILVYGSTRLVDLVTRTRPWSSGAFFEPEQFTYAAWAEHYESHLLNTPNEHGRWVGWPRHPMS